MLGWIEQQTDGLFLRSDFVPVPCCFPTCNSVTYAYVEGETVLPLPRVLNVDDYLDYISNRVVPDLSDEIKRALEGLWSSSAVPGSEKAAGEFLLSCAACGLPEGTDLQGIADRMFMVVAAPLRLPECVCVGATTPAGMVVGPTVAALAFRLAS